MAALAVLIAVAWQPSAHADGGASARNQATPSAPDDSGATIEYYAQRILRALADDGANNRVRYWRAKADCEAAAREGEGAAPMERVLLKLTGMVCARLDARLGVNPGGLFAARGEERTVGLLAIEPGAAMGYTLFIARGGAKKVYLIDPLGAIAHSWHIPDILRSKVIDHAKLLDNGNLLATIPHIALEFDSRGNVVWQHNRIGIDHFHHDFLKMPNGNVMLLGKQTKTREQVIAAGANPEFIHEDGLTYDYLLEVRPTGASGGEIVWEWSVWDHLVQDFDPSKPNYGAVAEHPELIDINFLQETISERRPEAPLDWMHTNSVDYNPELDQIMLSPRHFSELWVIDHSATTEEARGHSGGNSGMGGDLLYRWGNPRAYGHGDADDQRLFWQHQTHWIPPGLPGAGNILLFNNGNEFPEYRRGYSSIDEIVPPVDGYRYRLPNSPHFPDAPEWTYAAETRSGFYARVLSGAQRLPNGNTLVVDGPAGTIFQVTPEGRTVWKYAVPWHYHSSLWQDEGPPASLIFGNPDRSLPRDMHRDIIRNDLYRAYWHSPDHPGLQALDLTPGAYIEDYPDLLDWARAAVLAGDFGDRQADARFDIYLDQDELILIYLKQPCSDEDTRAKFFLHIIPTDVRDLPVYRQKYGFRNSEFMFDYGGKTSGDWCIAVALLPRYPIERIRTGQFTGEGRIWDADIELGE